MRAALALLAAAALAVGANAANDTYATNPLGAIKQVIFVRHGEHGEILDKPTPCLSEVGMGRGMMLSRYFDEGPPGVKKPTMIFAMNGSTTKATPPSVRCINTAIPYFVTHKLPPSKFNRDYTQGEPATVAAAMLKEGAGETIVVVWLHWDSVGMLNYLGVPVTGWNDFNLDKNTTDVYNPVIVVTPTKDHVHAQLFRTPDINRDTLQADWDRKTVDKLYWERKVSWADVAKQQGSVDRVVPVSEA